MQTVRQWLEQLGLSQYAEVFEGNQLNLDLAKDLTDQDLRELGVAALGHRKVLLRAIAALPIPQSQSLAGTHASALDQTSPPEGERRQLTVLFCDLVGSTELSRQLDPEDLQRLIVRYQEVCATAIRRFDGFVAQFLGDGVLAYFGYPTAHEGEAERAILAGLAALEAVIGLEHAAPIRLRARAGVATGVVVVGQIAAGTALEKAAIGEAPNTAARLQGLAAPGSLLIDERTRELAAGAFDYEDLGKHALKGRPEPVRVFRVVGQSRAQSRFEAATSGSFAPMVGASSNAVSCSTRGSARAWARGTRSCSAASLASARAVSC